MHNLINRKEELSWLESSWRSAQAQLLVVYGRRRIGKTYLLEHFARMRPHVYYLCSKGVEAEQLWLLSERLAAFFKDNTLLSNPLRSWDAVFKYVADKARLRRFVFVIDEFPFLVSSSHAITSLFQKYWDELLSKTKIMLILCGSSIAMMESEVLAYKSPLYGRRTGQWKMLPMRFVDVMKFFPRGNLKSVIEFYAVAGGVPFYLSKLDRAKSIIENIRTSIARKGQFLYEEGEFLLKEELAEPQTYISILRAVAEGCTRQAEIANAIGMPATGITRYLVTLIRLGFLDRKTPVTEKPRTKRALYFIRDQFLCFWFRFIYPNKTLIEEQDYAGFEQRLANFNQHVSQAFEGVCTEALRTLRPLDGIGSWWGSYREDDERKTVEIDIISLNEKTKEIIFAECKWKEKADAKKILDELKEKAQYVVWNNENRKETFFIFAKSFKEKFREKNVQLFDINALKKIF